mmetsp:Transcript_23360/g.62767  ORF Transcript_23360/g.62767 Transcript_23360/m.62767 type:complete len:267 (-) Transcript_23360:2910-3710(-)
MSPAAGVSSATFPVSYPTIELKLYMSGRSSELSVHAVARISKLVSSAKPVLGEMTALPEVGGEFISTLTSLRPTSPSTSVASRRNVYSYPAVSLPRSSVTVAAADDEAKKPVVESPSAIDQSWLRMPALVVVTAPTRSRYSPSLGLYLLEDSVPISTDGGAPAVIVMIAWAVSLRSSFCTKASKRYWSCESEFAGRVQLLASGSSKYPFAQYGKPVGSAVAASEQLQPGSPVVALRHDHLYDHVEFSSSGSVESSALIVSGKSAPW